MSNYQEKYLKYKYKYLLMKYDGGGGIKEKVAAAKAKVAAATASSLDRFEAAKAKVAAAKASSLDIFEAAKARGTNAVNAVSAGILGASKTVLNTFDILHQRINPKKIFFITDLEGDIRPLISIINKMNTDKKPILQLKYNKGYGNTTLVSTSDKYSEYGPELANKFMAEFKVLGDYIENEKKIDTNIQDLVNSSNRNVELKELNIVKEQLLQNLKSNLIKNCKLILTQNIHFVYGGDVGDHGIYTLRLKKMLVDLKRVNYLDVTLLIGNRDVNKLRFYQELYFNNSNNNSYGNRQTLAPWCNEKIAGKFNKIKDKIDLLKFILEFEMGSPHDFEFRRIELMQLTGRIEIPDDVVWLSFIIESVPEDKYEEVILAPHKDLINTYGLAPYIGISYDYLSYGKYIDRIGNTIVTHCNILDNTGNINPNDDRIGYENMGTIESVNIVVKDQLTEYHDQFKTLDKNDDKPNTIDKYWFNRPGGLLIASACALAFDERTKSFYEQLCIAKKTPNFFNWGYARYQDEYQMPKKMPEGLVKKLADDGIKYILTGHTPQPVPVIVLKHSHITKPTKDVYFIGADTSYGCYEEVNKISKFDKRLNSGSALVVEGEKCTVYGVLGKKVNNSSLDNLTFNNNGTLARLNESAAVNYEIDNTIGNIVDITEQDKTDILNHKDPNNGLLKRGNNTKKIIIGKYRDRNMYMFRNNFYMHSWIDKIK
jgi:hypothetical protein